LINFGLDIKRQTKTEKTMTELNLSANLNLTLSSIIEEGKALKPVFGEFSTGLSNIGNSCYLNSVI
jgi:ubiquitin carboxyl-terminal hydrolase 5/13